MAKFITFEGIDGTGKSSVCEAVHKELLDQGYKVKLTLEPSEGWLGQIVRQSYKKAISPFSEALLFCADRAEHTREIRGWLAKGYHVLCDRYVDSTIAYQGAILRPYFKGKGGKCCKPELELLAWLKELNRPYIQCPDLTVLLLCPPVTCLERVGERGEKTKFERLDLLTAIESNYQMLRKSSTRFVTVDARKPLEDVIFHALKKVRPVLGRPNGSPDGEGDGQWDTDDEECFDDKDGSSDKGSEE